MSAENENKETLVESENLSAPVVEEVIEDSPVEVAAVVEETVVEDKPAVEEETVITNAPSKGKPSAGKQALTPVENGAIGTGTVKPVVKEAVKKTAPEDKEETVALHSTKNVVWQGVGKVSRGVNIVSKTAAEQWLTRSHITELTPEQVAKEFNK